MRKVYRRTLAAWFLLTTTILTVVGVVVYHSITGFIEETRWVNHTHQVLETLSDTLVSLATAEGAQRGYIVTGKRQYMVPFYEARPRINHNIVRIELMTADNATQRKRITDLKQQVNDRLATMEETAALREISFAAAHRAILTDKGRKQMEAVRTNIDAISADERLLLDQRSKLAAAAARQTILISIGGIIICCFVLLGMLVNIGLEAKRREIVETDLQSANGELQNSLTNLQRLTREATLLGSMGDMLQSCRTADEAYIVVGRMMPQLMPDTAGAICILNSSQNLVEVMQEWGIAPETDTTATQPLFAPDECWGLRRGRLHLVQDSQKSQVCHHLAATPPASYMCLPMASLGETLGIIYLEQAQTDVWTEDMQRLAHNAAEQISLALANLKLQETLRIQSIRDPLTGLFNRRYLEASLEREMARATRYGHPIGIIMIDIDHFKRFNDTYGHEAGDTLLSDFGELLSRFSRGEDIACRYGGEEFTLIMPGSDLESSQQRAEELRQRVKKLRVEYRRQSIGAISISLGVAAYPQHGNDADDVLRLADAALYRAKNLGRDRVVVAETNLQEISGTDGASALPSPTP